MATTLEFLQQLQSIQDLNITTQEVLNQQEEHFIFDGITKKITVPDKFIINGIGVLNDCNAESVVFETDNVCDGKTLNDKVCIIQYTNGGKEPYIYHVTNKTVTSEGKLLFSWTIDDKVTKIKGNVQFALRFYILNQDKSFLYNLNSEIATTYVKDGLNVIGSLGMNYGNALEQLQAEVDMLIANGGTGGSNNAINDITPSTTATYSSSKIESLLADIMHPLVITSSASPSVVELGRQITQVVLSWTYNKNIAMQLMEGISLDPSLRSYNYSTPLTASKTFTLTATTTSGSPVTKTTAINFYNGVYYGRSSSIVYNNNLIQSLTQVLSDSRSRTITVTAAAGEYIYYCLPSRLGIPVFTVSGFIGGFSKVATTNFTNNSGYTESYDVYKSDNIGLGSTTITVS